MKMQVAKLRRVLSLLELAVPKKGTLDVLRYVRLGEGKAVASDLDIAVTVDLPEIQDAEGVCLLPFAMVENFLRFTPGSLPLGIVSRDGKVHLLAQGNEASFPTMNPEEYPPLPQVGEDVRSAVVDGDDLVKSLTSLAGYTATDDSRPVLTAMCLALEEPMEAAAADGFQLAVRTLRSGFPGGGGRQALVSRAAIKVLERLWKLAPSPTEGQEHASIAELVVSRRPILMDYDGAAQMLRLRFGEMTLMVRLVEGTFPDYRALVPSAHTSRVTFHAEELLRAVYQVRGVAKEGTGVVRLRWEEGRLTVEAKAEDVGDIEVALRGDVEAPGRIAFNVGYLMGYLKGKEGPITLSTNDSAGPGVFTHQGTKVVIMPMFVQDQAPKGTQPEEAQAGEADAPEEEASAEIPGDEAPPEKAKPKRTGGRGKKQE